MTQFRGHREDDTNSGMTRAEDRSLWMRSAKVMEKYKIVWVSVLFVFTAAGFDFKTPKSTAHELQIQIDTLKARADAAIREQKEVKELLQKLTKIPCLDKNRNQRDLEMIGIDCPSPAK
jgi:hypothetical protein